MFSKLLSVRLLAVLLAALLLVVGVQFSASAATARTLTVSASPAVSSVGTAVTFSGKISKSPKGTTVLVQRKSGKTWVKAGSTKTVNATGSYSVRIARPKTIANYSYRAYVAKKGSLKAATSKAVTVAALKRTFASLSATPASTSAGTTISLAGTVFPFVKGTGVTLQKKVGSAWSTVGTTSVTANGTFAKGIVPSTSTTYRASIARAGNNAPVLSNERNVVARPTITTTALTAGTRFGAYSLKLATFGAQSGTWTAAPLPAGLTLNGTTGTISGTPTATGDTQVTLGFKQTGTGLSAAAKTLTLRVNQAVAPTISTTSLPNGTVDATYSATLQATGNPVGTWSATGLPGGLTLNQNTGAITGTPTQAGLGDNQVTIGFTQTNTGLSATPKTITLKILSGAAPVITTTSLPIGHVATPYTATLQVAGNPAGTWSATGLPAWARLDATTGVISGTPGAGDADVDSQVTVGFTQTSSNLAATPKVLTLQVDPGAKPVIETASLPNGTRLSPYTTTLTAVGNPAGTWGASPLPAGLTLNTTTGVISGTPTAIGTTQVVVTFTQTNTALAATPKTLPLTINEAAAPTISTVSLPDADRLQPYTAQLSATGNPAGIWTQTGLPADLTLNQSSGIISGTPATAGDFNVSVTFTQNSTGLATTKVLVLHVNEASAPVISTANLPEGNRLAAYSVQLTAAGNPVGTWGASPLPAGLTLNTTTGVISGTPTAVETQQVVITFTQTNTGLAATPKTLPLKINEAVAPVISTTALLDGQRYHAYSAQLTAAGDPAGTWVITGLPAGMSGNSAGLISGTPTNIADANVVVKFTQTNTGLSSTKTLTLHIAQSAPIITTDSQLPHAVTLSSYSTQLAVAPAPVGKWTLVSGGLPLGVTLKADGRISGTATLPGNFQVTIRFTETSTNLSTTKLFKLTVS